MEEVLYLNDLFDIYKELLTVKQREYFTSYYFNNLSYGEIAEKHNISRNAIFKQLKLVVERLKELEEILGIYNKNNKIRELINNVSDDKIKLYLENLI